MRNDRAVERREVSGCDHQQQVYYIQDDRYAHLSYSRSSFNVRVLFAFRIQIVIGQLSENSRFLINNFICSSHVRHVHRVIFLHQDYVL